MNSHPHDSLPTALYSARQVRDLDARLIAAGTPGFELMQRAAHAAWRALRRRWPDAGRLTVLAGHGNNAGDGYLVAALAQRAGWNVRVLAVGDTARLAGDAASAHAEALAAGVTILPWHAHAELHGVLVDALYTGKAEQFIETQVKFEDGRKGSVSATLKITDAKTFPATRAAA